MTKMKDQPWYNENFEKYPNRPFTYRVKFTPGMIYVAKTPREENTYWYCEGRSDKGFIFFRKYNPRTKSFSYERVRRKPEKESGNWGESVEIIKNHTTSIRGYHAGGSMLYARNKYNNKKTHKVPAPFGL